MTRVASCPLLSLALLACGGAPAPAMPSAAVALSSSAAAAPSAPPTTLAAAPAPFRECGERCKAFATVEAAFDFALAENPRVLAIGEAHAQAGNTGASTTRRFMDGLLPRLAPRASDLVIELPLADGSCGKVERQVEAQQAEVTAPQASTNKDDFKDLGFRAKALRIMPRGLVLTCDEYQRIAGAGQEDILVMLKTIRDATERNLRELLAKRAEERLIVAYVGALHNDLAPREGREEFTFGPAMLAATAERYVELDLIVPEQIKDNETWRAQPWYSAYSQQLPGDQAYLISWAPHAYALIFPKANAPIGAP